MKKRVILVTGHYLESDRKAGFHWLADAYWRAGWEVIFFTSAISWFSWLQRNYRMAHPILREAHRLRWVREALGSYVWFTPWHPVNLGVQGLDQLLHRLFVRYGDLPLRAAEPLIRETDLCIFESKPGLMLFERFRRLNPLARYVYRVSDDLRLLRSSHRVVLDAEARYAGQFDVVSVPSRALLRRFEHLPQAVLHPHGIRKELFAQRHDNPYTDGWEANLVFVGTSHFDVDFLRQASAAFPRWAFHIIGPIAPVPRRRNVFVYGEMAFEKTVPFLQHADIGLGVRSYAPGIESLSDSLKMIQYTYCQLPIVAPEQLRSRRNNTFYYRPGEVASIVQALRAAREFEREKVEVDDIYSWDTLAQMLSGEGA